MICPSKMINPNYTNEARTNSKDTTKRMFTSWSIFKDKRQKQNATLDRYNMLRSNDTPTKP